MIFLKVRGPQWFFGLRWRTRAIGPGSRANALRSWTLCRRGSHHALLMGGFSTNAFSAGLTKVFSQTTEARQRGMEGCGGTWFCGLGGLW